MEPQKKVMIGMLTITSFVLIVSLSSLYVQMQIESGNVCGCAVPLYLFIPFLSALGLFIGVLTYYLVKPVEKDKDKKLILDFLERDESEILKIVFDKKRVTQAEIGQLTNLPRVKVFRVIERLIKKGILKKEKDVKTNIIKFSEKFEGTFKDQK